MYSTLVAFRLPCPRQRFLRRLARCMVPHDGWYCTVPVPQYLISNPTPALSPTPQTAAFFVGTLILLFVDIRCDKRAHRSCSSISPLTTITGQIVI
ncbi:hypothetical protein BCV70DRAFT_102175 [Testicularia cyperi]|uniref:Uncharacterized protein n=1 Tax=Testicularia cyperi TaxID=1882483 RepID=A0A317XEA4_9BASI|nr:hypothetical protein BCV70DRAFT_102175 [Testicularia cyperi]